MRAERTLVRSLDPAVTPLALVVTSEAQPSARPVHDMWLYPDEVTLARPEPGLLDPRPQPRASTPSGPSPTTIGGDAPSRSICMGVNAPAGASVLWLNFRSRSVHPYVDAVLRDDLGNEVGLDFVWGLSRGSNHISAWSVPQQLRKGIRYTVLALPRRESFCWFVVPQGQSESGEEWGPAPVREPLSTNGDNVPDPVKEASTIRVQAERREILSAARGVLGRHHFPAPVEIELMGNGTRLESDRHAPSEANYVSVVIQIATNSQTTVSLGRHQLVGSSFATLGRLFNAKELKEQIEVATEIRERLQGGSAEPR